MRDYFRLLQRWLVFPRETIMKALSWPQLVVAYSLALLPSFAPGLILLLTVCVPSRVTIGLLLACLGVNYLIFAHFNVSYLRVATPWRKSWLVPLIQLALPLQLAVALLMPQRIIWRGHHMEVEKGGTFRMLLHRCDPTGDVVE